MGDLGAKIAPKLPQQHFLGVICLMVLGIVAEILFQKSGVFDVTYHPVRPFCLTMEISLVLEGLKFSSKIEKI